MQLDHGNTLKRIIIVDEKKLGTLFPLFVLPSVRISILFGRQTILAVYCPELFFHGQEYPLS